MMCASCGKSEVDDKAQEELKKRHDACDDYSNEIVIENDTQFAAASPPPPQEDHDIVVEAFAVPEEDIVVTAAEQGENHNNGEQQQDDDEAVVQHPPQPEPSSSDNVPAAQGSPKTCGTIDIERLKRMMTIGSFIFLVVGIIMIIIGGVSKNQTILSIGIYIFIIFLVGWFLSIWCGCVFGFAIFRIRMARLERQLNNSPYSPEEGEDI